VRHAACPGWSGAESRGEDDGDGDGEGGCELYSLPQRTESGLFDGAHCSSSGETPQSHNQRNPAELAKGWRACKL
jgi:hypothetical protein